MNFPGLLPKQPMATNPKRNPNLVYYINDSSLWEEIHEILKLSFSSNLHRILLVIWLTISVPRIVTRLDFLQPRHRVEISVRKVFSRSKWYPDLHYKPYFSNNQSDIICSWRWVNQFVRWPLCFRSWRSSKVSTSGVGRRRYTSCWLLWKQHTCWWWE